MIKLPTAITPPCESIAEYTIMLYGAPKIGKSTFASQFDKPLFLATEAGLNALSTYQLEIKNWQVFLEACAALATEKHDYKTVVIDTIDNLAAFCSEFICHQNGVKHLSEMDYGKGYAMARAEFQRAVTKLSLLPFGLIMVSHEKTEVIKTRTAEYTKAVPTLDKQFRKIVLGMADMILYAHAVDNGNNEQVRVMRTKPAEQWEAGDRTKRLPETIEFSYQKFISSWKGEKQ